MNSRNILLLLFVAFFWSGCTTFKPDNKSYGEDVNINILSVDFDSNYKRLYVNVLMNDSITSLLLGNDTTVSFKVEEFTKNNLYNPRTQPELEGYENLKIKEIADLDLDILVLVDLTLDSAKVAEQNQAVRSLKKLFALKPFRIAFVEGETVSESMEATDYVLDNYFKAKPDNKYLYRSILFKIEELDDSTSLYASGGEGHARMAAAVPEQKVLIVLSDGKVYDRNRPIDPRHFNVQHDITQCSDSFPGLTVFFVNLMGQTEGKSASASAESVENPSEASRNFLMALCQKTNGAYLDAFEPNLILNDILKQFDKNYADYRFTLVNPDLKIYRGMERKLQIGCYRGDSLIASDYIDYNVGSIYNPVIINGLTTFQVILQGGILGLLTIFLLYLFFQLILPGIRYLIFKKKYVTKYTGKNMIYNEIVVSPTCYFCKAPFEEGR